MIFLRLTGGLGNQLFQYAAGRGLAALRGAELVFDLSWFTESFWSTTERPYELYRYPVKARPASSRETRDAFWYTHTLLKRIPLPRHRRLYRERQFHFDPGFLELPGEVFLDGYWQSPRYFTHIASEIRTEAQPLVRMGDEDLRVADSIARVEAVAVHVRRGDFVSLRAAAEKHGTCSPRYYRNAVRTVMERVHSPHLFVFSDDPVWVYEHLRFDAPVTHVTHNKPVDAFQDLRLMALCRHQIIANSSLSWWGAWLNPFPGKVVVAPKKWFRTAEDTTDLIPDSWISMLDA